MNMFLQEEKLQRRIHELATLRFRNKRDLDIWQIQEDMSKEETDPPQSFVDTQFFRLGDSWKGRDRYLWLQATVDVSNSDNICYFDFGKTGGGGNSGFEALLYVDGVPVQGIDSNHQEYIFQPSEIGKTLTLNLKLWSGLEGGGEKRQLTHTFNQAFIGKLDSDANAFYAMSQMILETVSQLTEDHAYKYRLLRLLTEAWQLVDWRVKGDESFYESIVCANQYLGVQLEKLPKNELVTVTAVGHTHIDLAWLWRLKHTREKVIRSFSTVLKLMKEYPEYVFLQSQPQLYQFIKEDAPDIYRQIKERAMEGRWEVEGAMWVEADCNIPSGESLVRQILYGKKFIKEEFGHESSYLWLPDVFGYSWALPQILKKSGIKTFMTTKISWNQYNRMPNDTFLWKGMDGSEILTHFITTPVPGGRSWTEKSNWFYTYNGTLTPETVLGIYRGYQNKALNQQLLLSYGHGDGGGGVTREMLENRRQMAKIPGLPQINTGRADVYFDQLHETVNEQAAYLPKWDGELYLEYHRGTYTSQAYIKMMNRYFEIQLRELEALYSCQTLTKRSSYPNEIFEKIWKNVLKNQFHDIIPGSSIAEVYRDYRKDAETCMETIAELKENLQAKHQPLTLVNTAGWSRHSLVKTTTLAPRPKHSVQLGEDCYSVHRIDALDAVSFAGNECKLSSEQTVLLQNNKAETTYYYLEWNQAGQLTRVFDKENKKEVLLGKGNVFQLFEDKPINFDAWDIDLFYQEKMTEITGSTWQLKENNPIFAIFTVQATFGQSTIQQDILLYQHTKRIDFVTEVDWQERQQLLKVKFDVNIRATEATYDIQHGNVKRPTHWNTSWDTAKFETVGHQWADLSQTNYGVALMNDCKYGYDIKENQMRLSLLKGAIYPDPHADLGKHRFTYSLFPHKGDFVTGKVVEEAWEINAPLTLMNADTDLIPFELKAEEGLVVDTIKQAENGEGWIIRCYDHIGADRTCVLTYTGERQVVWQETSMMEEPIEAEKNTPIELVLKPYEVKTIKIKEIHQAYS
ncbi:hypothetical protein A5886_000625 [Enterococcus sp. 8G7_MSG3316]|uniref:Glycoside hydrolase family 38 central domain-containing protein n=1 Tax=Candidatus Enterococcus testudinis TaxID=1834191 RepID=A0A242A492_9ENTE|nr:alpha-mannosidase [Enterococcus sp. 8G7_MSG3316]OTN75551.1 hypothetical protein A5886_000625 [Enterococcus sp. 8G7_MSG3316]